MPKKENSQYKSAIKFFFSIIKPYKKWFVTAITAAAVMIGINLTQTYITKQLIDASIEGSTRKIIFIIVAFILVIGMNISLTWLGKVCTGKLSALCARDMKRHIAGKVLNAEYGEVIKLKSGDTLNTLNSDTAAVTEFISGNLISLFSQVAMGLGAIIYLFVVNPILCIVTFSYTPLGIFFTMTLNKMLNKLYPQNADLKGEALSIVEQALSCIPVIKSFLMDKKIMKQIDIIYGKVYKNDMQITFYDALLQPACSSVCQIPRLIYLLYGGSKVMNGSLSVGTFVAFYSLLDYILIPTVTLPFILNALNRSVASINRIRRMDDLAITAKVRVSEEHMSRLCIKVSDVAFSYDNQKQVLANVSFENYCRGVIALKGESGSGKTTLIDLISGLYKPQKGLIEVCKLNASENDITVFISVVSQDTYLFPVSIKENIRYGKPNSSDEEIEIAAIKAGAHGFISELKDGYETVVGDGNTGLSGGQKQRIALAQAILKDAPVWLLDEPTSALDYETESIIISTIKDVSKDKLVIVSAHRQSLLDFADRIITLECGVVK